MPELLKAPVTPAQQARDALLGALVGLARATCAMPCGNTNDYDFVRLWAAPESIRTLKLQMLSAAFALAQKRPQGQAQAAVYQLLFTLAEDWDEELLAPVVQRAKELCRE